MIKKEVKKTLNFALFKEALIKFFAGFLMVALLLFIPAGTLEYWNAWLLITLLFLPMFYISFILMLKQTKKCLNYY